MSLITHLIVHCSDSLFGNRALIDQWHRERGWPGIGYHRVIQNGRPTKDRWDKTLDGYVEVGIHLNEDAFIRGSEIGRHTLGYNARSVGVCLIGKNQFTLAQMTSLTAIYKELRQLFGIPVANVLGHYETESGKAQGKTCPNIDMVAYRKHLEIIMGYQNA